MGITFAYWVAQSEPGGVPTSDLLDWLSRAGGTAVLVLVLVLLLRGDLVTRGTYTDVVKQRDRALDLLYDQANIAHDAVDISKRRLELDEQVMGLRQKER